MEWRQKSLLPQKWLSGRETDAQTYPCISRQNATQCLGAVSSDTQVLRKRGPGRLGRKVENKNA
jgi:hypothetical protein